MRKKTMLLMSSSILFLASCQKERTTDPQKNTTFSQTSLKGLARSSAITLDSNIYPLSQLVLNSSDSEDEAANKVLLHLGSGLREVLKNPVYANWIHTQTAADSSNTVTFEALFNQFPEALNIVETTVDPLGTLTNFSFDSLQNLITHSGISYQAVIYLANAGGTTFNGRSILSPGLSVPDATNFKDAYFAWDIQDSLHHQVMINEPAAFATSIPVYSVSTKTIGSMPIDTYTPDILYTVPCNDPYIRVGGLQINYAFESDGQSEVSVSALVWENNSQWDLCLRENICGIKEVSRRLKDIKSSDIGNYQFSGQYICHQSEAGIGGVYLQYYERDWINSKKDIGLLNINGITAELKGNMKWQHEVYGPNLYDVQNFPIQVSQLPYVSAWYTHYNNNKGYLHIDWVY